MADYQQVTRADWIVVSCTADDVDGEHVRWTPLTGKQTPSDLKDPGVMGRMVNGEIVKLHADSPIWYRAQVVSEPVVQQKSTIEHQTAQLYTFPGETPDAVN